MLPSERKLPGYLGAGPRVSRLFQALTSISHETMSTVTALESTPVTAMHSMTQDTPKHEQNAPPVRIPVLLPDMFVSFMARKPRVNPHYEKVREESEAWINRCALRRVGV